MNQPIPETEKPGAVACTGWLDSAEWGIEHRDDGVSFLSVPDRDRRNPDKIIRPYWIGPLSPEVANWLLEAIHAKQSNEKGQP